MRKRKVLLLFVAALVAVFTTVALAASSKRYDVNPILIVSHDQSWETAVAAEGTTPGLCINLPWSYESVRVIEPWLDGDLYREGTCGKYDRFELLLMAKKGGEMKTYVTSGRPVKWGSVWVWDGGEWRCTQNC